MNISIGFLATVIALVLVACVAAESAAGDSDAPAVEYPPWRASLLLNGVWHRAIAPDGEPPTDGWQPVRVPHRSREFEDDPPQSAWYATRFAVPRDWSNEASDIILDLSRVRHYARVYVNGSIVGEHYGMRTPFAVNLTDRVKAGDEQRLVVFTHNCSGTYAHPSGRILSEKATMALRTVFWYTGASTVGMEGDVWLRLVPRLRIEDVYVVTSVREKKLTVEATVRMDANNAGNSFLRMRVTRRGRTLLLLPDQRFQIGKRETKVLRVSVPWEDPIMWGRPPYGEPVLYFLQVDLAVVKRDGTVVPVDADVTRFGFREVWTEGEKLLLNGKPLFPWGDHSVPYVHDRQWLTRKLPDLASGGVSVVEHHRYDAPPILYDVADELGAFVISSNFCVGSAQVPGGLEPGELQLVVDRHLEIADVWIRRDRNHPSILFWDVTDTWEPAYCAPLLRKVKELDKTRIAEVTYNKSPKEVVDLIDTYRLFSSRQKIEETISAIRANDDLPVKPIRVGEAGIFAESSQFEREARLMEGWLDFIDRMPERNIHGLQTFFLTDMDYRGFTLDVPGMLAAALQPKITWPSQSGTDARIDPFGKGTQAAWGKAAIYCNWCDPAQPVSRPTPTRAWWKRKFRELTGRDVGPLAKTRVPEVIVTVTRRGRPVAGAQVFCYALEGQGMLPCGVRADGEGTAWFVLPEEGRYRFTCGVVAVSVSAQRQPIDAPPGYGHIQHTAIELP